MKSQKRTVGLASAALLALSLVPSFASAQELENVQSNGNLHLSGYGSFFLDGSTVFVDGKYLTGSTAAGRPGNFMTGQMYVQFMKPQAQNGKKHVPIVFVQGCCLTAKSWQTTPDGRMGWDEYFVRQGFDTYLVDQVARARSGFNPLQYQKVLHLDAPPETNPNILVGTDNFAWSGFRWGDFATKTPHPGIRFPMNTVGVGPGSNLSFYDQIIPDMTGTLSPVVPNGCAGSLCIPPDPAAFWNSPAQMALLANKLGGAILVGHSQSSPYPTRAALQPGSGCYPFTTASACKVKGIIQLETGCYGTLTPAEITTLSHIPILIMVGDFMTVPQPAAPCPAEIAAITAAGGDIKFASLPDLTPGSLYPGSPGAIHGNEHMMMLDNNNLDLAQILIDWASSRGL